MSVRLRHDIHPSAKRSGHRAPLPPLHNSADDPPVPASLLRVAPPVRPCPTHRLLGPASHDLTQDRTVRSHLARVLVPS
eukprot:3248809-Rhodomonas_salina.1